MPCCIHHARKCAARIKELHLTWQSCRLASEDVIDQVVEGGADKGRVACSTLVQHTAQGPQVRCTGMGGAILKKLWRHVAGCAALGLQEPIILFVTVTTLNQARIPHHQLTLEKPSDRMVLLDSRKNKAN